MRRSEGCAPRALWHLLGSKRPGDVLQELRLAGGGDATSVVIARLTLFTDLSGAKVNLGQLLEQWERSRRVLVCAVANMRPDDLRPLSLAIIRKGAQSPSCGSSPRCSAS